MSRYNFRRNRNQTWQQRWADCGAFAAKEDPSAAKYYVLEMFPYPSGKLHVGHGPQLYDGRPRRPLSPCPGLQRAAPDGMGRVWAAGRERGDRRQRILIPPNGRAKNIATMRAQLERMGFAMTGPARSRPAIRSIIATNRKCFSTSSRRAWPTRKESWVNWDPVENTVLANEQVIDGRGWRSNAPVEKRLLSQWFLRITDVQRRSACRPAKPSTAGLSACG